MLRTQTSCFSHFLLGPRVGERLQRGGLIKKDPFSREEVYRIPSGPPQNRQLQSPTPTLKTLLNGSIRFRAPSVDPQSLVLSGAKSGHSTWVYKEASWSHTYYLQNSNEGLPHLEGVVGLQKKGALTADKGEGERAGRSYIDSLIDRGKEMWPGWWPDPRVLASSFRWSSGCWLLWGGVIT